MSKGDELKFEGGAATKAEREYGKEGGHNRDHTQDGMAVAQKSYSRRPRKCSCDSMTCSSSCARSNPGIVRAIVVESALRRLYPVSCALQVGNGVLPRLRPRAFPARSLRRPPAEDGRLELLRGRHWATPIYLRLGDRASLAEPPRHCKR